MVVKYGSRVRLRPGSKPKQLTEIAVTDPTKDPENFANREAHIKALGGKVDNVWGSPVMKDAALERKGQRVVKRSYSEMEKAVRAGMERDAMRIVKYGMPEDTEKAAELTQIFGPGVIAKLLDIRSKYLQGLI